MLSGIFFMVGYSSRNAIALFIRLLSFLALFVLIVAEIEAAGFEIGLEALRLAFFFAFFLVS